MIAEGPFNCGFVHLENSCSGYHFSCESSVKDKLTSTVFPINKDQPAHTMLEALSAVSSCDEDMHSTT